MESFYKSLLIEGRAKKLQELARLASEGRPAKEEKRLSEIAERILADIRELDEKIAAEDGPGGLDYRDDANLNESILRFLEHRQRGASQEEINSEMVRGRHRGYKDERAMDIRVGRCIRAYTHGRAKISPRLRVKNDLVGLYEWPDELFD